MKKTICLKKLAAYTQLCQKFGLLSEKESKEILQKLSEHKPY
ncbi:hypothetical protein [Pseudalkalibacillus hwajinpoensis]|nr:hypothetical protein [Pseudalkalibacillus hwajinpoensis]